MPPDAIAFNQRYRDIGADLIDYMGDRCFLKAGIRVRFTYCQQGTGADMHFCDSVLGLFATRKPADIASLIVKVESLQKDYPDVRQRWAEHCGTNHHGVKDPYRHTEVSLRRFLEFDSF